MRVRVLNDRRRTTSKDGSVAVSPAEHDGRAFVLLLVSWHDAYSGTESVARVTMTIEEAEAHVEAVQRAIDARKARKP